MQYVFGYGSLMYPLGLFSRGLSKTYVHSDFKVATLDGYVRELSVFHKDTFYYGIYPGSGKVIGTLFQISDFDLTVLAKDEVSLPYTDYPTPAYRMVDITNHFNIGPVFTFEGLERHDGSIGMKLASGSTLRYIEHVFDGIQYLGKDFIEQFLKTGGVKP